MQSTRAWRVAGIRARWTLLALGAAALAGGAQVGRAQEAPSPNQRAFGVGLGAGSAAMSVGSQRSTTPGLTIAGRLGIDARNRLLVIAEFSPAQVDSPVLQESFRAVNLLLAFGIGKSFKVRPGLGIQFRSWSGSERVTDNDATLLFALDAGPEFRVSPTLSISPEAVLRYSMIELEGSVGSRFIGVQLVASWRLANH